MTVLFSLLLHFLFVFPYFISVPFFTSSLDSPPVSPTAPPPQFVPTIKLNFSPPSPPSTRPHLIFLPICRKHFYVFVSICTTNPDHFFSPFYYSFHGSSFFLCLLSSHENLFIHGLTGVLIVRLLVLPIVSYSYHIIIGSLSSISPYGTRGGELSLFKTKLFSQLLFYNSLE